MDSSIAQPKPRQLRPRSAPGRGGESVDAGLATLKEGVLAVGRASSVDGFLADAVHQLSRLIGIERASVLLLNGERLHHAASIGLTDEFLGAIEGMRVGPGLTSCAVAAHSGETAFTDDIATDPACEPVRELAVAAGVRSCLSVPLKLPDGTVLGTFAAYGPDPGHPDPAEVELTEAYASIVALGLDNVSRKAELAASYESAVLALTSALDVRDDYTGAHSTATSRLVREVCVRMGLTGEQVEDVARVAALHDVGKLGVPTEILTSTGRLTAEQARVMRDHPVIGEQILRQIPGMEVVAKAVRHEHERWDGGGYPDGISGTQIPLASRIVFACDAYHAMVSDRSYRTALDQAEAIAEMRRAAGSQFDPEVVAALLEVLGDDAAALGCSPSEVSERNRREALERVAAAIGAEDVFVFRKVASDTYSHLAGAGRGEGWAGNIELRAGDSRFLPAVEAGEVLCLATDHPARIVGPYYARSAVVVPCRHDVIVVFGSSTGSLIGACETEVATLAERVARMADHVPPAKRLADELEVLDAVRAVTTVNASGVEGALGEIAERAAMALSCEFAAVVLDRGGASPRWGSFDAGWAPARNGGTPEGLLAGLAVAVRDSGAPLLIQDTDDPEASPPRGFGAAEGVASLHVVPIDEIAIVVTVHAEPNPRGFTSLCQRVARSLADGAEIVVRRALAQEELSRENAKLELRASTDPLTGVNNRGGWDEALVRGQLELSRGETEAAVAVFDLDDLKGVNDRLGHAAGDELLRVFAGILAEGARGSDYVARIGGDEFAVLLRDCGYAGAAAWCERVTEAVEAHNAAAPEVPIEVSWGCAAAEAESGLAAAMRAADRGLYGDKSA